MSSKGERGQRKKGVGASAKTSSLEGTCESVNNFPCYSVTRDVPEGLKGG